MKDVYGAALAQAKEALESYAKTPQFKALTKDQVNAVRIMVANAYVVGYDAGAEQPAREVAVAL